VRQTVKQIQDKGAKNPLNISDIKIKFKQLILLQIFGGGGGS